MPHPNYPQSNVSKFNDYDPEKYALDDVSPTVLVDESLLPNRPPSLTQRSVGKFLQPLTRQLVEVPPRPTIDELPDAVIENMVKIDKAFWVDKPGANAYTLHDAYYNYGMTTEKVLPPRQNPFPRSYQYDLDCVIYRRQRACQHGYRGKQLPEYCRKCDQNFATKGAPSQSTFISDTTQRRWRYYPDLTAKLSSQQVRDMMMNEVGRPFKNDACSWYNENYPTVKYDCTLRKFSK
ncbi:unnamed protein product [Euphydryas editha]|uniref:Uncharacterized protein n=1 Tax=Euphydryas editha TaxID=104508 RepID=A0AAU9UZ47_EUPED|nr:unnamed protein product [Euphydryas editha]